MIQDLEYALGEVEYRDGIPDLKFSKVKKLSSIIHKAFSLHFHVLSDDCDIITLN